MEIKICYNDGLVAKFITLGVTADQFIEKFASQIHTTEEEEKQIKSDFARIEKKIESES